MLQKLLKYFNGTLILIFFVPFPVLPTIFVLNLNEALLLLLARKSSIAPLSKNGSSLNQCHKLPDVLEYLSLYSVKLYIGITMSMPLPLSICVLFLSLTQLVNGVQFLVIIFFLLFAAAPAAAVFGTVIVTLTIYMHHYNHIDLTVTLNF